MSVQFYHSIIEDEKSIFHIKDATLKIAAKQVAKTYSKSALKEGSTFLNYNIPQNRCAYLFKYAALHTQLVSKYFKIMIKQDTVKFILEQKKDLKICCLGGGPGTDVVGLFKALATLPACHQKVSEVTILDVCGGWRNSFKHIISRIKHGKVDDIPAKFIDSNNFQANLIAVDLLENLPGDVIKVISNADIICMVKFVSAILGKSGSGDALKAIGEKLKFGSIILFIDNFRGKVFESLEGISRQVGLLTILGPLHVGHRRSGPIACKKNPYGCAAQLNARVSVIGSIKTSVPPSFYEVTSNVIRDSYPDLNSKSENDDSWDTDSDSDDICSNMFFSSVMKHNQSKEVQAVHTKIVSESVNHTVKRNCDTKFDEQIAEGSCDKFTQTQLEYFKKYQIEKNNLSISAQLSELPNLIAAVSDLFNVMNKLKQRTKRQQCCCEGRYK